MEDNKNSIEVIARAVIIRDEKTLICRGKGNENYFFPGGHVEFGEYAEDALRREFMEEIGIEISDIILIGMSENIFAQKGEKRQEINIVYSATIERQEFEVLENHMEFKWADVSQLPREKVFPEGLKEAVIKWNKDGEFFYSRQ